MALTEHAYLILYEMAEYNEEICEESVHFKQTKTKPLGMKITSEQYLPWSLQEGWWFWFIFFSPSNLWHLNFVYFTVSFLTQLVPQLEE